MIGLLWRKYAPAALGEQLLRSSSILFAAQISASALNYLYVVMAGRYLEKQEFGSLSALLSIISLSLVLLNPFQLLIAFSSQQGKLSFKTQLFRLIALFILLCTGTVLFQSFLQSAVKVPWEALCLVAAGITLIGINALVNGALSGIKAFTGIALGSFTSSATRVIILLFGIQAGLSVQGGLYAYNGGLLAGALVGAVWWVKRKRAQVTPQPHDGGAGPRSSFSFTLMFFGLVTPFFLDQLLVEGLHHPLSGDYGAVMNLAKIVFFAAAPIIAATYPYLLEARFEEGMLSKTFFLSSCFCLAVASAFALPLLAIPEIVMQLSFGSSYSSVALLVPVATIGMLFHVAANLLGQLLLVQSPYRGLFPMLGAVIFQLMLFLGEERGVETLVWCQAIVFSCQFFLLCIPAFFALREKNSLVSREGAA